MRTATRQGTRLHQCQRRLENLHTKIMLSALEFSGKLKKIEGTNKGKAVPI